jgi:hypothetical protein
LGGGAAAAGLGGGAVAAGFGAAAGLGGGAGVGGTRTVGSAGAGGGDAARPLVFLGFGSFLSGLGLAEDPGAGIRYTRSS